MYFNISYVYDTEQRFGDEDVGTHNNVSYTVSTPNILKDKAS